MRRLSVIHEEPAPDAGSSGIESSDEEEVVTTVVRHLPSQDELGFGGRRDGGDDGTGTRPQRATAGDARYGPSDGMSSPDDGDRDSPDQAHRHPMPSPARRPVPSDGVSESTYTAGGGDSPRSGGQLAGYDERKGVEGDGAYSPGQGSDDEYEGDTEAWAYVARWSLVAHTCPPRGVYCSTVR